MKVSCGTDIIKIDRIEKSIEKHGEKFINSIYSEKEIEYCESHKNVKYQHYAARFAAKEATYKAITKIFNNEEYVDWNNIEVVNDENGRPAVNFKQKNNEIIKSVDITLSHSNEFAIATVVILYE